MYIMYFGDIFLLHYLTRRKQNEDKSKWRRNNFRSKTLSVPNCLVKEVKMPDMVSLNIMVKSLIEKHSIQQQSKKAMNLSFIFYGRRFLKALMSTKHLDTKIIHNEVQNTPLGATHTPIFQTGFSYESMQDLEEVFQGKAYGHYYSRVSNPTIESLESRLAAIEGAIGAIVVSSGMAAILQLCRLQNQ